MLLLPSNVEFVINCFNLEENEFPREEYPCIEEQTTNETALPPLPLSTPPPPLPCSLPPSLPSTNLAPHMGEMTVGEKTRETSADYDRSERDVGGVESLTDRTPIKL